MLFPIGARVFLLQYTEIKHLILIKCGCVEFEIIWRCGALILDGKQFRKYLDHLIRRDNVSHRSSRHSAPVLENKIPVFEPFFE